MKFIFSATIEAQTKEKGAVVVLDTAASKGYCYAAGIYDATTNEVKIVSLSSNYSTKDDNIFREIFLELFPADKMVLAVKNVTINLEKIMATFGSELNIEAKDSNNLSLSNFLRKEGVNGIEQIQIVPSLVKKLAFKKKTRNFDDFWNSPDITDAEKQYATATCDLDIIYSNYEDVLFKRLERSIFVDYPQRKHVFNVLFGDPASGKTTKVESLAALYHIPMVKITGDPRTVLQTFLQIIGPATTHIDYNKIREDYLAQIKNLGVSSDELRVEEKKIESIIAEAKTKPATVELIEQQSIYCKCFRLNLPLILFMDEINLFASIFMSTVSDVITSGYANVGVSTYRNVGNTIMYFGAYNPKTYKSTPFEGKFFDRMVTYISEPPTETALIEHKQRKYLSFMQGETEELVEAKKAITGYKANIIAASDNPSLEAVEWLSKWNGREQQPSKAKEYRPFYLEDVVIAAPDQIQEAVKRVSKLFANVNTKLRELTHGLDTMNPDRDSEFYLPDRMFDVFADTIMCYNDVEMAVIACIINAIPNGHTLRNTYTNSKTGVDTVGPLIAAEITKFLSAEIASVNTFLFSNLPTREEEMASLGIEVKKIQTLETSANEDSNNDVFDIDAEMEEI